MIHIKPEKLYNHVEYKFRYNHPLKKKKNKIKIGIKPYYLYDDIN